MDSRNCGLLTGTILVACAAALGLGLTYAADERVAAVAAPSACTAKQKKQRQLAVSSYKKRMPKDRPAYYRKHKSRKLRAAFVKKQQARLKALQKSLRSVLEEACAAAHDNDDNDDADNDDDHVHDRALSPDRSCAEQALCGRRRADRLHAHGANISAVAAGGVTVRDPLPSQLALSPCRRRRDRAAVRRS